MLFTLKQALLIKVVYSGVYLNGMKGINEEGGKNVLTALLASCFFSFRPFQGTEIKQ